jgi:hypothetical protein
MKSAGPHALGSAANASRSRFAFLAPQTLALRPPGLLQVRPVGADEPVRIQTRVDRLLLGASFQCKLDGTPFGPCQSPKRYRVSLGRHTFKVKAVGDSTPAVFSFRVKPKF